MKACFMGLGYIGLPTAIIAAGSGIQVIGVDVNPKVVEMTNRGIIHIVEPGLQELCSKVMESGKLKASDVPEESDVYLIVVPTPFKGNHEPDISYVEAATRMVAPFLKKGIFSSSNRLHLSGPPKRWQICSTLCVRNWKEKYISLIVRSAFYQAMSSTN